MPHCGANMGVIPLLFVIGVIVVIVALSVGGKRTSKRVSPPNYELRVCGECGYLNRPKARFCAQCGQPLP